MFQFVINAAMQACIIYERAPHYTPISIKSIYENLSIIHELCFDQSMQILPEVLVARQLYKPFFCAQNTLTNTQIRLNIIKGGLWKYINQSDRPTFESLSRLNIILVMRRCAPPVQTCTCLLRMNKLRINSGFLCKIHYPFLLAWNLLAQLSTNCRE